MQQLVSNNYTSVQVLLRDETITMPAEAGARLMQYLSGESQSSHVMITDTKGNQTVVNKNDIRKVTPLLKSGSPRYKTAKELGMPDLS